MRAFVGHAYGPPESLVLEELPAPAIDEGEARIAIRAAAVNFADTLFAAGQYQVKPQPPFVPGFEIAGEVVESRSPALGVGSRVLALLPQGGYASECTAPVSRIFKIPDALPFDDAAGLTITYQTAWLALHRRAQLQAGEFLLVHAGAGGVGSAAIQLGKAAGATVIATAGGADKVAICRQLGADFAIDYKAGPFINAVKEITQGRGADVIFDSVGGEVFEQSTKCIAFEGRIIIVGFASGTIPSAKMNHALVKNYSLLGLHWFLYLDKIPELVARAQQELFAFYESGKVKPLISESWPLERAAEAMRKVSARGTTGKLVLHP